MTHTMTKWCAYRPKSQTTTTSAVATTTSTTVPMTNIRSTLGAPGTTNDTTHSAAKVRETMKKPIATWIIRTPREGRRLNRGAPTLNGLPASAWGLDARARSILATEAATATPRVNQGVGPVWFLGDSESGNRSHPLLRLRTGFSATYPHGDE